MTAKKKSIKKQPTPKKDGMNHGVYVWETVENGRKVFLVRIHDDADPLKRGYIIDGPKAHREYAEYMADKVRDTIVSIIAAERRRPVYEGG